MWLWIVFAVLTAVVIIVLLAPIRPRSGVAAASRGEFDLAVYRDQLAELDRDAESGLIGKAEADAARNEISRRILSAKAAADAADEKDKPAPAWLTVGTVLAIPAVALGVYLGVGRPELPAQPLASRLDKAVANQDMVAMVRQVEKHLEQNPRDAKGWGVLAPIYNRMGRHQDAANAYRQMMLINGPDPATLTDLAETLVIAKQGLVEADALKLFQSAAKADPANMKARFFIAMARDQEGKKDEARKLWQSMLDEGPADAAWRPVVERQMAALGSEGGSVLPSLPKGPALTEEQMQAGQQMSGADRNAMIRGMVEGLDKRLAEDGSDLDGWLRLIRARMVLGQKDKAADALNRASEAFKDDERAKTALDETRKALGL
ncbi:MAG: c-type cytochrome biogenesis protein CcmI [Anderseniella sp.]|nr:c-type cytochrome biogenesis protein CcmI [Anderseniella sp.]